MIRTNYAALKKFYNIISVHYISSEVTDVIIRYSFSQGKFRVLANSQLLNSRSITFLLSCSVNTGVLGCAVFLQLITETEISPIKNNLNRSCIIIFLYQRCIVHANYKEIFFGGSCNKIKNDIAKVCPGCHLQIN